MLAQMEHLRFLRRALVEELITEAEFIQHKQRALQPGVASGVLVSCLKAEQHARPAPLPPPLPAVLPQEGKEKQIGNALLAAILALVENQPANDRKRSPLVGQKQQPRSVPVKPGRRKQVIISPPRPAGGGPRSPAFRSGAKEGAQAHIHHHRFDRQLDKNPILLSLDPLEFDLGELWQEPVTRDAAIKPAPTMGKPAPTTGKPMTSCNRDAKVTAARFGRPRHQRPAVSPYRQDQEQRHRKVGQKPLAQPTVTRIARPPVVPRVGARSPAAVRRAAAFVAHAAGLKPQAAPAGAAPTPTCEPAQEAASPTTAPHPHPRVRISLHAEVLL